jgi:hypothetical protein
MATTKQKEAARHNLEKARAAQHARAEGKKAPATSSSGNQLSTADKNRLGAQAFAFPKERKEPLTDARHVRNAIARFDQVKDVTDHEREQAFANIKAAAKHYGVDMAETSWHDLGKKPHTVNPKHKKSA